MEKQTELVREAKIARAPLDHRVAYDHDLTMPPYWHKSPLTKNDGIYNFFHIRQCLISGTGQEIIPECVFGGVML